MRPDQRSTKEPDKAPTQNRTGPTPSAPRPATAGSRAGEEQGGLSGAKPDEHVVDDAQEAAEHLAEHQQTSGESNDDARHGFSQDSGYAQSGGTKREPTTKRSS